MASLGAATPSRPGAGDLTRTPKTACHIDMTLDEQRSFSEDCSCAGVATKSMVVGDIVGKMVHKTTEVCRSRSPAETMDTAEAKTTTTTTAQLTCISEVRPKTASRVPLSFGVDSIMAGTVRRCNRDVVNNVNGSPTTRFSVDNILGSVCVNRPPSQSLSPGRCHLTGTAPVALMSEVSPTKMSSDVPAAWATTGPDFLARQGKTPCTFTILNM